MNEIWSRYQPTSIGSGHIVSVWKGTSPEEDIQNQVLLLPMGLNLFQTCFRSISVCFVYVSDNIS